MPVFTSTSPICDADKRHYILLAAILASALGFIDGSVVAIALPAMRVSLGADLVQAQWIHNAYMLTLSALILTGGALGDRFGMVRVFAAGIALFVGASLACALAPTPPLMIAARAVQGVGAAVMVPGSLALIARAYPAAQRGRAIGTWAAAAAITTAIGPIIGGSILSFGGPEVWRWIFAINLPLGALALWLLRAAAVRDPRRPDTPVDWSGAGVATLSLLALAWGLTQTGQGDNAAPWLVSGVVLFVGFLWVEARGAHPMMPLNLFAARPFAAANAMSFTLYSALGITLFFLPMTLITGWGVSEIEAAASFAPFSVFIGALSRRFGALADRIGPAPLLIAGCLITAIGYLALGFAMPYHNLWLHVLPAMSVLGLGMACVVAPLSAVVMGAVEDAQTGIASAINNAVTRMAGLIAVAAVGGVVASSYAAAGGTEGFGAPIEAAGHGGAMIAAFQTLTYVCAGLSVISAGLAVMTRAVRAKHRE